MRFRSKIDAWLILLMLFAAAAVVVACAAQIKLHGPSAIPVSVAVFVALIGPCIWMLISTYYWFEGGDLRVNCGPRRWRIPLDQVHFISRNRSMLASAALSADRFRIDYGQGKVIFVSPKAKEAFLSELEARRSNKSLERTRGK
jgi:hypothetical protein